MTDENQPTEPGFYWALFDKEWTVVEVFKNSDRPRYDEDCQSYALLFRSIGEIDEFELHWVEEWGPRLSSPDESPPFVSDKFDVDATSGGDVSITVDSPHDIVDFRRVHMSPKAALMMAGKIVVTVEFIEKNPGRFKREEPTS